MFRGYRLHKKESVDAVRFEQAINTVWKDSEVSHSAVRVFLALVSIWAERGRRSPLVEVDQLELSGRACCHANTVSAGVHNLERRQHIQIRKKILPDGHKIYSYVLLYPNFGWFGPSWAERILGNGSSLEPGKTGMFMKEYRCITLYQPLATLVALGEKKIETRSRAVNHTGILAIHASLSHQWLDRCSSEPFLSVLQEAGFSNPLNMPFGKVVCICNLTGCFRMDEQVFRDGRLDYGDLDVRMNSKERAFGDYREGRYGYVLEDVLPFSRPIPARGMQGLWKWEAPADLGEYL